MYTKESTALVLGLSSNPVVAAATPVSSLDSESVSILSRDLLTFLHREIKAIKFSDFLDHSIFFLFFVFVVFK